MRHRSGMSIPLNMFLYDMIVRHCIILRERAVVKVRATYFYESNQDPLVRFFDFEGSVIKYGT